MGAPQAQAAPAPPSRGSPRMPAPKILIAGIVAAALSAALAVALQMTLSGSAVSGTQVRSSANCVTAARDLPAGHRIAESDLEVVEMGARPTGELLVGSRALAVGRTTAVALAKGQAIRSGDLVTPGSGAAIASQLAHGMRAITVSLRDTGPEVVLYPGALVDMLATLERPGSAPSQRESVTVTLLEAVRVLAVNDEAVGTRVAPEAAGDRRPASRRLTVTLAVTPAQAAQLELASARGTIGITLRPDDAGLTTGDAVATATTLSLLGLPESARGAQEPRSAAAQKGAGSTASLGDSEPRAAAADAPPATPERRIWRVTVIRGESTVTHQLADTASPTGPAQSPKARP